MTSCFVFAVVGGHHVERAFIALSFLKRVTRHDIVVVQARSDKRVPHDQVLVVNVPQALDDHQASTWLKTDILSHVSGVADRFCYLDSDVIAINDGADEIFDHRSGPVTFAQDHVAIDEFSKWAIRCGCRTKRCEHLREALLRTFGVEVLEPDWRPWNSGVFLFDEASRAFFEVWHTMTSQILAGSYWRTRDQGTLAGAAWKLGLEHQPSLPAAFNFIVDCMRGIGQARRSRAEASESFVRTDYTLTGDGAPHFVHFINGGIRRRGWRNWDDAEALLPE